MKFFASVLASTVLAQDSVQPCGPRLMMGGASGNLGPLNGQWKFAMDDSGNVLTNVDYPVYKLENSIKTMWWMWHGAGNGHWVINDTPGQHGGDILKSTFADFACPQDIAHWEIGTSQFTNGDDFALSANPCCQSISFDSDFGSFSQNENFNAEYPVYQQDGGDVTLWWMWHGSVGHWVMNSTPGQHGGDILKSAFDDAKCPDQVAAWEGSNQSVSCVSGEIEYSKEYCKRAENKVDFVFAKNKNSVFRRGGNSYILRVRTPRISETRDYTGILAWGRKDCGQNFLTALYNGDVMIDVADMQATYKVTHKSMGNIDQHTNVVFQFDVHHDTCDKCLGNSKQDQFELLITGLDNVDFKNKDKETCIKSLKSGFLGTSTSWKEFTVDVNPNDVTPCISWTNMYW